MSGLPFTPPRSAYVIDIQYVIQISTKYSTTFYHFELSWKPVCTLIRTNVQPVTLHIGIACINFANVFD